jgi:hypothetical protein
MSQSTEDGFIPYSQREEWADVVPIAQHESLTPVAPIFYTDNCEFLARLVKELRLISWLKIEKQPHTFVQSSNLESIHNVYWI